MESPKQVHKTLNFLEGIVALFTFVGILGLTAVIAFGLNPKVAPERNQTQVASAETTFEAIIPTNLYRRPGDIVELKQDIQNKKLIYSINIKSLDSGETISDLIKLNNSSNAIVNLKLSSSVNGYLGNDVAIQILADNNAYDVYKNGVSSINSIKLEPSEEKILQIKYSSDANINYPVTLTIELSY